MNRMFLLCVVVILLAAQSLAIAAPLPSVVIQGIPHVRQKPDFCGEACVEMWLRKLGHPGDQDYVFNQSGLSPELGRGCYTHELTQAVQKIGFQTGEVFTRIPVATASTAIQKAFEVVHADLKRGVPSILCTHFDEQPDTTEHFRLIVGYDAAKDEVIYQDPAIDNGDGLRMPRKQLFQLWPLKYSNEEWTLVTIRLEPGQLTEMADDPDLFSNADYAQHILKLKDRLPHKGFSIVLQRPFVVVGDESVKVVRHRATSTVKWAVDHLKKEYFTKDPNEIIDVWLFRDAPSYEDGVAKLSGRLPSTPYGFYSSEEHALYMNISTGGGTLVHEIVHPFIESNFPKCPSWFNEGLASLYEQSNERDGRIIGMTNWRLAGLQSAIREGTVPPFETLCGTSMRDFYHRDRGTNYSQARYLCYYLQERGLLQLYYRTFRQNVESDATGYESLKTVLDRQDMDQFQKEWEAEVVQLKFP